MGRAAGAIPGTPPQRRRSARRSRARIGVVYGGGRVALMGVLADAALAAGGDVTGVMPTALVDREVGHRGLTRLVDSDPAALVARLRDAAE